MSNDAQAELTRANDIMEARPEQRLSRSAARAGTAADHFQVSLSPALGLARGFGVAPFESGAEASRGGPLAPADNYWCLWKSRNPWTQAGEDRQQLLRLQGDRDILAEDTACLLQ